jgi:hypothetical protein
MSANCMTPPAIRVIATIGGFAFYVGAGWVLLTHVLSNHEATSGPPSVESHAAGVTITVSVLDGPTLYCATTANMVAVDTIAVTASEVPGLFRELGCWEPGD